MTDIDKLGKNISEVILELKRNKDIDEKIVEKISKYIKNIRDKQNPYYYYNNISENVPELKDKFLKMYEDILEDYSNINNRIKLLKFYLTCILIDDDYIPQEFVVEVEKEKPGVILHLIRPEIIELQNMRTSKRQSHELKDESYLSSSPSKRKLRKKSKSKNHRKKSKVRKF